MKQRCLKSGWLVSVVAGITAMAASAADYVWQGNGGNDLWSNPLNWTNNDAPPDNNSNDAIFPSGSPTAVTVDVSTTIRTIYFRNPAVTTITIAPGVNLFISNSGGTTIRAEESAVIDGDGTVSFSTGGGENWADNKVIPGKTLTFNVKITGGNGFEHNGEGGVIILNNPANDYEGSTTVTSSGWLQFPSIADAGIPCPLGMGSVIRTSNGELRYTGTGDSTDRQFQHDGGGGSDRTIEHAGTGTLTLTGPIRSNNNNSHAFIFNIVNPAAVIDIAGTYINGGTGAMWLYKRGPGTMLISSACSHTGNTVVDQGTLEVVSGGSLGTDTLVQMRGGRLLFSVNATIGAVSADAYNGVSASTIEVASGLTLTMASLSTAAGSIDFSAPGLASTTKIFITGQAPGLMTGVTINGGTTLAAYDTTLGVCAYVDSFPPQNLDALGPGTISDDAGKAARITGIGTGGGINLAADPTATAMLSQEVGTAATVDFGMGTLVTPLVQIALGGANLTLNNGTLTAPDGILSLANMNAPGGAALTVNTAVADNGATAVRIFKDGSGDVVLDPDALAHTGGTAVNKGALTLSNAVDTTWANGVISGGGGITKDGIGTLFFPNAANTYGGTTTVTRGTVSILHSQTFGSAVGPTVVKDNGAIDFIGTANQSLQLNAEEIFAEGAGPDGNGALRNTGSFSQYNAIRLLTLTDELTLYPLSRLDVRASGGAAFVNLNGHGFVKKGTEMFGLTDVTVTNDQNTSFFDIHQGSVTFENGTSLTGGTNNYVRIRNGAYFDLYNITQPINWSLNMDHGARIFTRNGNDRTRNIWAGPVTLAGDATFESGGTLIDSFTGDISGPGRLFKTGNDNGTTYLLGTNNTWSGGTQISGGMLYAATPDALPNYDTDVTVLNTGTLALRVADTAGTQPGFAVSDIQALLNPVTFQSIRASIGFDTLYEDLLYTDPIPHVGIVKLGPNTLTPTNVGPDIGPLRVYGGTLDISNVQSAMGTEVTNAVVIGQSTSAADPLATLVVGGNASITTVDRGYNVAGQPIIYVGDQGRGVMYVSDDAFINGRLYVGNGANAAGAVYQTGGTVHNTGGANNDGRIGMTGYGYYLLADGVFTNNGYSQLGCDSSAIGIIHQTGGAFYYSGIYNGNFGISRGGTGMVHQEGGTFYAHNTLVLGDSSGGGTSDGYAAYTVTGDANLTVNGPIDMGNLENMTAILNLNGGEVNASRVFRQNRPTNQAYVNWDGGLFRATNADSELFSYGGSTFNPDVTLYGQGAVIDIPDTDKDKIVSTPLRAPEKLGLLSIPIASGGAGYLGSPFVRITGGGGAGASAFAHVQDGVVTSIEITSPGTGYTSAPTVTLERGGFTTAATLGAPVMGFVPSGGLTKLGEGALILNAASTYMGPTEVREGTLKLTDAAFLPPYTEVSVTGGTLDLGGGTLANGNVSVTGGAIVNGHVSAAALDKDGPGTLVLSAPLSTGPASLPPRPLTPGLWEGMIRQSWNLTSPNPRNQGIQFTTRAANGGSQASNTTYAGGLWNGNDHTWIYSGYIWNTNSADVTWTFFGRFDDNMMLIIDGIRLINATNGGNDLFVDYTLTPGPHHFEARFGDGSGEVGPGPVNDRTLLPATGPLSGLLVDYSGNGTPPTYTIGAGTELYGDLTNFQILEDPGDGSLFTLDLPGDPDPLGDGPGLHEYLHPTAAWDTTSEGILISRQLTTRAGNGLMEQNSTYAGGIWTNGIHTWIYRGYLWNRTEENVTWRWRVLFDDNIRLSIDDTLIVEALNNNQTPQYASHTLTPGAHPIEIRFGDGGGGVGPHSGLGGLTYDPTDSGSTDWEDYILLEDPGDGSLLTTSPDIEVGFPPDPSSEPPDFPTVNVTDGTLRLERLSDAGLWEGVLHNSTWNTETPNPNHSIQLTTRAGNLTASVNENSTDIVPGTDKTVAYFWGTQNDVWIYTGYLWNRTGQDQTWTWRFGNWDDRLGLWIDDELIADHILNAQDAFSYLNHTFTPGAHKIEVRFFDGGGNVGPAAGGGLGGLTYSTVVGSTDPNDYTVLADPGDGSLLTWTDDPTLLNEELLDTAQVNLATGAILDLAGGAHQVGVIAGTGTVMDGTLADGTILSPAGDDFTGTLTLENVTLDQGVTYRLTVDGDASDCLFSTGTLDLSGVTIVPATGAPLTATTYVIAHSDIGFGSTKPLLDGFPFKYQVLRQGKDLVLTSRGPTILILR